MAGQSFVLSANASNFGSMFVILDDFPKREEPGAVGRRDRRHAADDDAPRRFPRRWSPSFRAPPVRGVGRTGGFKFMVEDRGDVGLTTLQEQADNLTAKGNQRAESADRASCPC